MREKISFWLVITHFVFYSARLLLKNEHKVLQNLYVKTKPSLVKTTSPSGLISCHWSIFIMPKNFRKTEVFLCFLGL